MMVAFVYDVMVKRTLKIKDQAARFVQPDLHLHCPQKQLKSHKAL